MPSERAASVTEYQFFVTSLTASTLNSRVKVRLFRAMMMNLHAVGLHR
jgi:hypothetical protein